jgi:hypothetical protein
MTETRRVEASQTRFAKSGDVSIAYQVVGDGPLDLVLVHGWVCTPFTSAGSVARSPTSIGDSHRWAA